MEKQIKMVKLDYFLDWTYGVEISKLKSDIEELEKLGATHVEIDICQDYDSSYIEIGSYCKRFETDDEFKDRVSLQKEKEEREKQKDLEQFQKLKSKYGL